MHSALNRPSLDRDQLRLEREESIKRTAKKERAAFERAREILTMYPSRETLLKRGEPWEDRLFAVNVGRDS